MLTYKKFYFLHDVFVGAVLIGDTSDSAKVMECFQAGADMETALAKLHGWK